MATDRAADVKIKGNAGPGGINPLSATQQKTLDAQIAAAVNQVNTNTSTTTTTPDPYAAAQQQNRQNWKELLKTTLSNWGLTSLIPVVQGYIDQGYTSDTALLMIQNTPEYKQRFAGNQQRIAAGFAPLSPDVYLSTEASYASAMRAAGLPAGFYDEPSDFSTFIGNNVSSAEVQSRINIAADFVDNVDPFITDQLSTYYGLDKGSMIAYALDPSRALPFIQKQVQAAQVGAEAARQGVNIGVSTAESLGTLGVTQAQARQGFEEVAQIVPIAQKLSQITAGEEKFGTEQAITSVFGGEGSVEQKRRLQKLAQTEQSRFAGQAGVGSPSLGMSKQGQF